MLIFGELSCWTVFGIYKSDPRLLILGSTGVTASVLMLARIRRTSENERPRTPSVRPGPRLARRDFASSVRGYGGPRLEQSADHVPAAPSSWRADGRTRG
jgi:hypothetical protein